MSGLDDGINHLRSFIAVLLDVKDQVQQASAALEERAEGLDQLEGDAQEQLGAFAEELVSFGEGLVEGGQESLEQLDKVMAEGVEIGGSRLDESVRDLDGAEGEFENSLQVSRDDLDKEAAGLTEAFQLVSSALASTRTEVDASRQESEGAFQGFLGVVQGFQGQVETTFEQGETSADAAVAELATGGAEVVSHAAQCEQGFVAGGQAMQAECTGVVNDLEAEYQEQAEKADAAGQDLIDSVDTLADDTAAFVAASSADQLDAPLALVTDDAVPELLRELDELGDMLGEAEETTAEVDALTQELETSLRVVAEIDELLDALD